MGRLDVREGRTEDAIREIHQPRVKRRGNEEKGKELEIAERHQRDRASELGQSENGGQSVLNKNCRTWRAPSSCR
jgi:hypothetical protein